MLDDGTGFATGRDGYDYGWDCDGDVDVDYSGGRRGLGRDGAPLYKQTPAILIAEL